MPSDAEHFQTAAEEPLGRIVGAEREGPISRDQREPKQIVRQSLVVDAFDDVARFGQGGRQLAAVDPVREANTSRGVVIAHIVPLTDGAIEAVERAYARYECAGVLVTLDAPNNFPQLPVRTDGPWLVWLGVFEDASAFEPMEGGEVVVLMPTRRSRLRWGCRGLEARAPKN